MQTYCRACRAAVPQGARYCPGCGACLDAAASAPPQVPAEPPTEHRGDAPAAPLVAAQLPAESPGDLPSAPTAAGGRPRAPRRRPASKAAATAPLGTAPGQGKGRALAGLALVAISAFVLVLWQWLPSGDGDGGAPRLPPVAAGDAPAVGSEVPSAPLDVEGIEGIVDIDPAGSAAGAGSAPAGGNADTREASRIAAGSRARDEAAIVLERVLTAQSRADLAALEREWRLDAFGAATERMQRSRLRAVAASLQIDEFAFRERATLFSEDGSHAMVRAEVSFRATHASGVSHWANGVLGVLRRADSESGWVVIAVIPDELLNSELAERADLQARWQGPPPRPLRLRRFNDGAASSCSAASAVPPVSLLATAAQDRSRGYAQPMTHAELNRELDAAMNREYGVTKLKFVANGLNTSVGQVPGFGDAVSFVYQAQDMAKNSMEVLGETMQHGFTHIGALKAAQVFAGVVQMASELVPPADVASDLFQYRLEAITANAEIRRVIHHLKQDLESGRLKFSVPRLRVAEGRRYPEGVRISIEDPDSALLSPANPDLVRVSFEGVIVGVAITTPDLLNRVSPRLPFEVVAQVVINPKQVRYTPFDERVARVLGAVQQGSRWVIPVRLGRQATADASTGAPILADFQRMRLQLDQGEHPDSAATWGWQPCRGTQRLAVRLEDGSSTLPVTVRNNFLNPVVRLVVLDAQERALQRVTLEPGDSLTDLKLVGIGPDGKPLNLSALLRRPLGCVDLQSPDPAVVGFRTGAQRFSIAAAAPGRTRLALRIAGDAETPDLELALPIVVTAGEPGWRLAEVQRDDFETPLVLNHRREVRFSDTGLSVSCGVTQTIPDPDLPMAQWPRVGYDADVRMQWGAMPDTLQVGQTVRINASVSRDYVPTSGWLGDAPPAYARLEVPDADSARIEAGSSASASFVVPPPRPGRTLGISVSGGACGVQTRRVFVYRPLAE